MEMRDSTAGLYCPICGLRLVLLNKDGIVLERKYCPKCKNDYLVLITRQGEFVMTAELKK